MKNIQKQIKEKKDEIKKKKENYKKQMVELKEEIKQLEIQKAELVVVKQMQDSFTYPDFFANVMKTISITLENNIGFAMMSIEFHQVKSLVNINWSLSGDNFKKWMKLLEKEDKDIYNKYSSYCKTINVAGFFGGQ